MPRFELKINDQQRVFEAIRQGNHWRLVHGEIVIDVTATALGDGRFLLEYVDPDGHSQRLHLAGTRRGDSRQLWVDGHIFRAQRMRQQSAASPASEATLAASIPAVVSQVLVSVGDTVAAGDKLILLESMKMVIPIQAPADGRVVRINCAAGDSVPAGIQLLELEPL